MALSMKLLTLDFVSGCDLRVIRALPSAMLESLFLCTSRALSGSLLSKINKEDL